MNNDKWPCYHCNRETKRINHILELPSCSSACDTILEEEYLTKPETHDE